MVLGLFLLIAPLDARSVSGDFLAALTTSASAIANGGNITHSGSNNHFTNALLVKLVAYDSGGQQSDLQDASALLTYIIKHKAYDLSFGGVFAAPIITGNLGDPLPGADVESLRSGLYAILPDASPAEPADVCYTNIFLMNTVNLILLGEALADFGPNAATAKAVGLAQWAHWLEYTRASGLHEFDSPTYTAVQLNALYMLFIYGADEGVVEDAGLALNLLWTATAASWFGPGHMIGGPHSRDYDALFGKGMLNGQLSLVAGFRSKVEVQDELYQCEYKDVHCEAVVCPLDESLSDVDVENCQGSGLQAIYAYINFVHAANPELRGAVETLQPFRLSAAIAALAETTGELVVEKRWQEGDAGDCELRLVLLRERRSSSCLREAIREVIREVIREAVFCCCLVSLTRSLTHSLHSTLFCVSAVLPSSPPATRPPLPRAKLCAGDHFR
jgi:hypothetical protein